MYTCTCLDSTVHSTICKHIHLLCMLTKEDILKDGHDGNEGMQVDGDDDNEARMQVDSVDQQCTDEQYTETEDNNEYFMELLKADTTVVSDGNSLKSDISDLAHQITSQTYSCHNNDILRTVKKQMQSAFSLMNHHNAVDNNTDSETVFQKNTRGGSKFQQFTTLAVSFNQKQEVYQEALGQA